MNKIKGLLLILILVLISGCQNNNKKTSSEIVTTFFPLQEMIQAIVSNEYQVQTLNVASYHDYEPSASDLKKIIDADVFIYNSLVSEPWVKDIIKNNPKLQVIEASTMIKLLEVNNYNSYELDPHTWLDLKNAQIITSYLNEELIKLYPEKETLFTNNTTTYLNQIKELDLKYETLFKNAKNKTFLASHLAFSYLALNYQLQQYAILGLDSELEPSLSKLEESIQIIKTNNITSIFLEENASSTLITNFSLEHHLTPYYLNTMETKPTNNLSYLEIMEINLETLAQVIK
ncbi:MAG: metal ABC transporter substrate-binding protein [Bacilli bacterium]